MLNFQISFFQNAVTFQFTFHSNATSFSSESNYMFNETDVSPSKVPPIQKGNLINETDVSHF